MAAAVATCTGVGGGAAAAGSAAAGAQALHLSISDALGSHAVLTVGRVVLLYNLLRRACIARYTLHALLGEM